MPTKTPAEIPAETAAAQQSHYDPAMPLTAIHPHPKNPRHDAKADQELIDSIRDQGLIHDLVVAPHPTIDGEATLIDGHRRYDALLRAGFTMAPVKVRLDLVDEADQVAAMLATIRREQLTPIEEAEGFDLLAELGWDTERIASATGRSKTTVLERRKLTRLPAKAKDAVDHGQVTIDDALRLAKLPAKEQTRLEKLLDRGGDFRYEIARTESRVKAAAEVARRVKDLKASGVPEKLCPKGATTEYSLNHADHGMVRIGTTGKHQPDEHDGCLAFVQGGTRDYPAVWLVCTDPGKHDAELTEEQRQRQQEHEAEEARREAQRAEMQAAAEAARIARQLRTDAIVAAARPKPALNPTIEGLARLALPWLMSSDMAPSSHFQDLAGVPEDQRWEHFIEEPDDHPWLLALQDMTGQQLLRVLAAYLADQVEERIAGYGAMGGVRAAATAAQYFDLLGIAGHETNSADKELIARLQPPPVAPEPEDGAA